ncbi:MAG: UMP kinase [Spirochaetales bacterium]|nr:UMP kinase [Spirochaetales bacterium]
MQNVKVISLGGSIVAPDKVDSEFLKGFRKMILEYLEADDSRRLIFVTGGGGPARTWQQAYKDICNDHDADSQDWIGVAATRLNASLVKGIFGGLCPNDVVIDPTLDFDFKGKILVAAGWKPGFSSDFDAVILAEKFGGGTVINLSNIAKVYSADPKLDPAAVPYDKMSHAQLQELVGDEWVPGKNVPFDPIATKKATELNLKIIIAAGKDLENLKELLEERAFEGTLIEE